jgi:hypothetical protein
VYVTSPTVGAHKAGKIILCIHSHLFAANPSFYQHSFACDDVRRVLSGLMEHGGDAYKGKPILYKLLGRDCEYAHMVTDLPSRR